MESLYGGMIEELAEHMPHIYHRTSKIYTFAGLKFQISSIYYYCISYKMFYLLLLSLRNKLVHSRYIR